MSLLLSKYMNFVTSMTISLSIEVNYRYKNCTSPNIILANMYVEIYSPHENPN